LTESRHTDHGRNVPSYWTIPHPRLPNPRPNRPPLNPLRKPRPPRSQSQCLSSARSSIRTIRTEGQEQEQGQGQGYGPNLPSASR
jgi:hypothetical protein